MEANDETKEKTGFCRGKSVCHGNADAIGYTWLSAGRGMFVMSNIYMSSSLLWLAANEAGCFDDGESTVTGDTCTEKVYGFTPSSLIAIVAVVAGLLSAFLMPICGALVDYSDYRRGMGIGITAVMVVIQGVQVGTVESTWFAMAILQAIAAFFYQLQVVVDYAYLIEICVAFGQEKMTIFSSDMTSIQFASQSFFLVVMVAITLVLASPAVLTAQISQGVNTFTTIVLFGLGWKYMTPRQRANNLPEGRSLLTEGFRQNWATLRKIQKNFRKGLLWYFYSLVFAEAAAAAITTTSIIYLNDALKLDSTQVGIFFLVTLLATIPGSRLAVWVTLKYNPNTSWKLSMLYLFVVIAIGVLTLEYVDQNVSFVWGLFVGIGLGWFYPTENLFFAVSVPSGQEAELSGFFVYCTQILSWLPPLLFAWCIESGVAMKYSLIVVDAFFLLAIGLLFFADSWEEIVAEAAAKGGDELLEVNA